MYRDGMSVRGWMVVLGAALGVGLVAYAVWPTAPSPEASRQLVKRYLETPPETRSSGLEHRVMQLRGHAALGAVGLLGDARLRGAAHVFLKQCARSGDLKPPAEIGEIEARARSGKRSLVVTTGDVVSSAYAEEEWATIQSAWQRWSQDNQPALEAMPRPCDPRYEL